MLSRLTRPAALLTVAMCGLAVLSACGDETSEKTAEGFDAVEVSGAVGEAPEIDWKARLEPGETQSKVLEEGSGAELENGDQVLINIAVSDDFTEEIAVDTFGEEQSGAIITVGEESEPQQALDLLTSVVAQNVEAGMTLGSRIAITANVKKEWGDTGLFLTSLDIGNEDGIVLVADLESIALEGPEGKAQRGPSWAPKVVSTDGVPTKLDSSGVPKPDLKGKAVRSAVLLRGAGAEIEKGDLAMVNYLGQTWGAAKPFDGSFERGEPLLVNISGAQGPGTNVIDGWNDALVGVPAGSRIIVEIPPAKGYGKQGQGEDIKGDDILYFVIDVLATS